MPISINWSTKVISIPQNYLTFISGVLYELSVNQFRLDLKDIEDGDGIAFVDTHRHNTQVTLGGVTYARTLEIINGFTVEFADGQYVVRCVGANHNLADVKVANQVSLIVGNAAGLIVAGSGVTAQDKTDIVDLTWDEVLEGSLSVRQLLRIMTAMIMGKATGSGTSEIGFRDLADTKNRITATVDAQGDRTIVYDGD